ncbi:hypothetical protein B5D80_27350 [Micromonospora wenchangensis]|uniref:Uncharacterized protein n=1 Tax=Micromonospora wenchangensis TaxID=1185415 RepID=A0A246REV7_9ACTN|nr:hypothetical protein [Micromonospora wenchangensis]OWV00884.1 hypothetical protein B5D80_27350 [Micromonospora wenchangensis]
MTAADDLPTIEFRRSRGRQVGFLTAAVLAAALAVAVVNLVSGDPWWDGLWTPALWILALGLLRGAARPSPAGHQPQLPLRLTADQLEVTGPGGRTLAVGWSNVARAEITGRLYPVLVIEPADPERTIPPLARWEWAVTGQSRPYEIRVPLAYLSPGRDLLRRELARRLPGPADAGRPAR